MKTSIKPTFTTHLKPGVIAADLTQKLCKYYANARTGCADIYTMALIGCQEKFET